MAAPRTPRGLKAGGRGLWRAVVTAHPGLDAAQLVQLEEACRAKDRCDVLAAMVDRAAGDEDEGRYLTLTGRATQTANQVKQLLAALRLPDENGKKPGYHGPRGVQRPTVPGGRRVSSLERARAAKAG